MSLNLCQFIGNAGRDTEVRYMQNGDAVASLSIGVTRKWKDKAGEKMEETEWVRVSIFGKLAEVAGKYVTKGKQVYIAGRMRTRKWTDKDGVDKYTTEVIADQLQLLGGREGGQDKQPARPAPNPAQNKTGFDDMDDDIPF